MEKINAERVLLHSSFMAQVRLIVYEFKQPYI